MSSAATLRDITLEVRRKIKRTERALETYVSDINAQAEEKLKKRAFISGFEAEIEGDLSAYKQESQFTKESFILEVDKRLEDQSQHRATRLHHKREIEKLLPQWVQTLDSAWKSCAAIGHNDKLYWRTAAVRLLKQSSEESLLDEFAHSVRLKLNQLVLNINTKKSQQVMDMLATLKEEYISSREDAGSALGGHSVHFREADTLVDREAVPLPRSQWSQKLDGSSTLLLQSRSILSLDDGADGVGFNESYHTATDGEPSWILDSMLDPKGVISPNMSLVEKPSASTDDSAAGDIYSGKRSKAFMTEPCPRHIIHSSMSETMKTAMTLRYFANHGNLSSAWQYFLAYLEKQNKAHHFDIKSIRKCRTLTEYLHESISEDDLILKKEPPVVDNVAKKATVRPATKLPTSVRRKKRIVNPYDNDSHRELFHLLMKAFKNSKDLSFDAAWMIIKTMILYGLEPDIRLMNVMLRSCERRSMWRRALAILKEMMNPSRAKDSPCGGLMCRIEPNAHTFDILISCCRHAIDEPGEIYKILRANDMPIKLCYKAAVCNAGNRISGQAARDQARQAKVDSDRHKKFLARCRKNRNAKKSDQEKKSLSLELLTTRSESSDGSNKFHDSPVRFPSIAPENSFDSAFMRSPTENVNAEPSHAFSSFYPQDEDELSQASSHQEQFFLGSQATEMSDDDEDMEPRYDSSGSPTGMISFKTSIDKPTQLNNSCASTARTSSKVSKTSGYPFSSNVSNDYGGGGGGERSSEWNMLSSSLAGTLPTVSPSRHRTGLSTLSFENQVAKVVKGHLNDRFVKGAPTNKTTSTVSKVLQNGNSRAISPLAARSYFSATEDEINSLRGDEEGSSSVVSLNSHSSAARLNALTSKSLLSDPAYIGRSMLNLTTLK